MKDEKREPLTAADLGQIRWASGTNILIGIWLFIAPQLLGPPQRSIRWDDIIVGVVLIVLAGLRFIQPVGRFWMSWINACIGLWLIAAPFVFHCEDIIEQVNDLTAGFVVFVAGTISGSVRSFHR